MNRPIEYIGGTRKDNSVWYGRYITSSELPPKEYTTASLVVPFYNNQILSVFIKNKGWNIPGGHIEEGETIEEALIREVMEEAGVELEYYKPIGYIATDYDPQVETYMAIFWGSIRNLPEFAGGFETTDRKLMEPGEFFENHSGGSKELMKLILKDALEFQKNMKQYI